MNHKSTSAHDIKKLVRRARILKDISQTDLAKRIGKKTGTIWAYETGRIQIPSKVLERIMDELGLDIIIRDME